MTKTAEHMAKMADRASLTLSERELAEVVSIVEKTGNFAPEFEVVAKFTAGALSPGVLTFFLPRMMWRYRETDSHVSTDVWRAMFQHANYTDDRVVTPRPTKTVRAYRGATQANREGLSWSLDVGQAEHFARSRQAPGVTTACVWVTNIPAERVFARYLEEWEKESLPTCAGWPPTRSKTAISCQGRARGGSGGADRLRVCKASPACVSTPTWGPYVVAGQRASRTTHA